MTRRSWAVDVALATVVGVLGQLEAWTGFGSTHRQGPLWVQALLYAVTALLLVGRRRRPLGVLAAMCVVSVVEFAAVGSPEGNAVVLAPLIVTFTAAHLLPWRRSWLALALMAVLHAAWAALDPLNPTLAGWLGAWVWFSLSVIAWLGGALVRTTTLNREQRRVNLAQRESQAVAEERNRIARELHDVLGHSVSVMTVQASAVRRRLLPGQVTEREALESVESTGREALAEMRRLVSVLRGDEEAELRPQPRLAEADRLADQFRAAGLPVSLVVTGPVGELPPGPDLTAYRVVQEGLTNTLRHAREPRRAEVRVDVRPDRVDLAVRDDGRPGQVDGERAHGTGLRGLRERLAAYGGSMRAGPCPDGGFELVATLPLERS
ncbi:sensor histidine kinase [Ornithinimicrobium cerasi]|uniref:histidine kinase n=1 Tax=Ornithinimicrobium cerasi TaxID=2248773 RepID=A0A285VEK6_9MICO|nr:sensor histidine kinase [Ornithinimicrobium cerasi]SOC52500.1 Signal transduction histidine kinase [Ornithinimicrobium cerasi]